MLYALPEGFPTPEPRDGKGLAKALGDAAARWMRGEYSEALARMNAAVVIAATERATNARIDRLERVVAQLDAWLSARERGEEQPPPSLNESIDISVVVPETPVSERVRSTPPTMNLDSRDIETVEPASRPSWPSDRPSNPNPLPFGTPFKTTKASVPLSRTMDEASRPTPRGVASTPPAVQLPKSAFGTTLPEGETMSAARLSIDFSKSVSVSGRDPFSGLDRPPTPSAADAPPLPSTPSVPDATPIAIAVESTPESKREEEKPRSKISTQRFVPPTTRRPEEGEVYPPMLPSEEDEGD